MTRSTPFVAAFGVAAGLAAACTEKKPEAGYETANPDHATAAERVGPAATVPQVRLSPDRFQVGYGAEVAISAARSTGALGRPLTFRWRQVGGPSLGPRMSGVDSHTLAVRTHAITELVEIPDRVSVLAINPRGAGRYEFEVAVSNGAATATARAVVQAARVRGDWPRAAIGEDVYLNGGPGPRWDWVLEEKPEVSQAVLEGTGRIVRLRPDMRGKFHVRERVTGLDYYIISGKWIGDAKLECARCHENIDTVYRETPHAKFWPRAMSGGVKDYGPECLRCHVLGFDEANDNGGFDDAMWTAGWAFPEPITTGTYAAMPQAMKDLGGVQCVHCHGAGFYFTSFGAGVCGQCHDAQPRYAIAAQWRQSRMASLRLPVLAEAPAVAPRCTACHSAQGFVAAHKVSEYPPGIRTADVQAVTCAACHDPHDRAYPAQLRVYGRVALGRAHVEAGPAAACVRCHQVRDGGEVRVEGPATASPKALPVGHPNAQANVYFGVPPAGVPGGREGVPGNPHGTIAKACVGCHMAATPETFEGGRDRVGGHTFKIEVGGLRVGMCAACHRAESGSGGVMRGQSAGPVDIGGARAKWRAALAEAQARAAALPLERRRWLEVLAADPAFGAHNPELARWVLGGP